MYEYLILLNPGHNRVYFGQSLGLSLAELSIAGGRIGAGISDARTEELAGIKYIAFSAGRELDGEDIYILSRLSFCYAIFRRTGDEASPLLSPVPKAGYEFVDSSLSSMLKYSGKTNELFTRLMINIASFICKSGDIHRLSLLDPVAGKGTTAFEGLSLGYDCRSIEIGTKVTKEAVVFLRKYLESIRYKHTVKEERLSGENRSFTAIRHSFSIARSKEEAGSEQARSLELIAGDTLYADRYFKRNSFDIIVGDLPYGVQHGNVTGEKQSSLTRNPSRLIEQCIPVWSMVLKPGGAVVFSWNVNTLRKDILEGILEDNGFKLYRPEEGLSFEHRVDQAIVRDVVIAIKI